MDAEWELVERSKSINAMAPAQPPPPISLADLEAAKREGNAHVQQRQLASAIQSYSFVVDNCAALLAHLEAPGERAAVAAIEVAVRLNRALANIQQHEFAAAEDDCTAVLAQQPASVKALYRRALAREQLGKLENAQSDLHAMLLLEPANPAALELRAQLDAKSGVRAAQADGLTSRRAESDLAAQMRRCEITPNASKASPPQSSERAELAAAAESAWRALQEEEEQMRRAITSKQQAPRRATGARKQATAVVTPTRNGASNQEEHAHDAFQRKTNDLWASLAQEEQRAVARVAARRHTGKSA